MTTGRINQNASVSKAPPERVGRISETSLVTTTRPHSRRWDQLLTDMVIRGRSSLAGQRGRGRNKRDHTPKTLRKRGRQQLLQSRSPPNNAGPRQGRQGQRSGPAGVREAARGPKTPSDQAPPPVSTCQATPGQRRAHPSRDVPGVSLFDATGRPNTAWNLAGDRQSRREPP